MNRKPIEMKDFNKPKENDQKFQNHFKKKEIIILKEIIMILKKNLKKRNNNDQS